MLSRAKINKVLKKGIVILLVSSWIFSGYPQVWNFPPEVKQLHATEYVVLATTSDSWQIPTDVYYITVEAWGAGGGTDAPGNNVKRAGAGGGAYSKATIAVTPGTTHSYTIGSGGGTDGTAGGDTSWVDNNSTTLVLAKGGSGNTGTASASGGLASAGTAIGSSTAKYSGGDGAASNGASGGGGGGAGSSGNGNSASTNTGGSAQSENGGAGGDGVTSAGVGQNGSLYGGGGGGSWRSGGTGSAGTTGAGGLIRITYLPVPTLSSPTGTATGTSTASGSVSTDQDNGTLYFVVTTSATSPTEAQVKAGNDHTGTSASDSGSQGVTATGTQNVTSTGLTAETMYYFHYMHENSGQSDVVTSSVFSTYTLDDLPLVSTYSPTNILINSVQGEGRVLTDSGSDIVSRGFVLATSSVALADPGNTDPEVQSIYSLKYYDTATGTGEFDVLLFSLATSTNYRYRAFAENSVGFSYGDDVGFSTTDGRPVVSTYQPTEVTANSAQGQGEIINDNNYSITRRGFVVATGTTPLSDPGNTDPDTQTTYSLVYNDSTTGTSTFDVLLFGLDFSTIYRYRAFAQNSIGFTYGDEVSFKTTLSSWSNVNIKERPIVTCGDFFYDTRDGNYYRTVEINNQCWFAEDLRYECENYYPNASTWTGTECADQDSGYDGIIYQLYAVMNSSTWQDGDQGLCPNGWHVPTGSEMGALQTYLETTYDTQEQYVADLLKDPDADWCFSTPCGSSGWDALPVNYRTSTDGSLRYVSDYYASHWTSNTAHMVFTMNASSSVWVPGFGAIENQGHSVRCLLDSSPNYSEGINIDGDIKIEEMPCGLKIFDSRDGNGYETVQIGDQCWMAEDLRYECENYYPDASTWTGTECADQGTGYYGLFYQWDAAMDGSEVEGTQGLCPDGWHIPTDEEIKILEGAVDSTYGYPDSVWDGTSERGDDAGDQLKDPDEAWCNGTPCGQSGWNALPGGYRYTAGTLGGVGSYGRWWSSSVDGGNAWFRDLDSFSSGVYRYSSSQANGFSVRCLRD